MKPWPLLVIGLGIALSVSCSKGKFSEDKTAAETYEIKVVDPSGDATAAPGTTTASVEGPAAGVDSKDSGSGTGTGSGTGDSGVDTGDSGSGKGGTSSDDTADSGSDDNSGSGKNSDKGKGKDSSKGGDADAGECASSAGINKSRVKVSGSQKSLTMVPGDAFALKVTGNQNSVHLKMSGDTGASVSAICLFLAGNQSHVTMDIGVTVGRIFIKARGNKALVEGAVSKEGVIQALQVDANGNQPSIVMKGEGSYPCDQAAVSCQKP